MEKILLLVVFIFINSTLLAQEHTHIVKSDETLYRLSKKYNVSIEDIKKTNPYLTKRNLQIEDTLTIPDATDIISNFLLKKEEKLHVENKYIEIVIESNETLLGISKKHNISIDQLMQMNNITDSNKIRSGQILRIPSNS